MCLSARTQVGFLPTLDRLSVTVYPRSMLLLPLLLSLPVCVADRKEPELKRAQLETVAMAIEAATPRVDERAALVTIAWFESRLCRAVHAGSKRGGSGLGLWQIEPGSNRHAPFAGLDEDATEHAAGEALWVWRHAGPCAVSLPARFRWYAGLGCRPSSWTGDGPRAAFMVKVLRKLNTPEPCTLLALWPDVVSDPLGQLMGRSSVYDLPLKVIHSHYGWGLEYDQIAA